MKRTKKSLLFSGLALMMSALLLAGTTFAWFTDSVTNKGNTIESGTLDIELNKNDETPLFSSTDFMWEPGRSQQKVVTLSNAGSLWLKYTMSFTNVQTTGENLTEVLDVYKVAGDNAKPENLIPENKLGTMAELMKQGSFETENGVLAPKGSTEGNTSETFTLVIKMQETADNKYQNASVSFAIDVRATQYTKETDGFGNEDYDAGARLDFTSVNTVDDLNNALNDGKVVYIDEAIQSDKPIVAPTDGKEIVINGNGNTITVNGSGSNTRVFSLIAKDGTDPGCAPDVKVSVDGVDFVNESAGAYSRGISFSCLNGADITISNSKVQAGYYALNFTANNENVTIRFQNATIEGWAALNCYANNSTFIFENCTLSGQNTHSGPTNNFSVVVLDGATLGIPGTQPGEFASGNTLTFNNCDFLAKTTTENSESILSFQYGACNNTVNFNDCTFNYEPQDRADFISVDENATGNRVFMDGVEISLHE